MDMCSFKFHNIQSSIFSHKIRKNRFKRGFTIIEIIITIVILVILFTIAFSLYIGYTIKARDSIRIGDINNIKTGLSIYKTKGGIFPKPDGDITMGTIYGKNMVFNGDAGENIGKLANISKTPIDPSTKCYYRYGASFNYKYFQVGAILENKEDLVYYNNFESLLGLNSSYADENSDTKLYSAIVQGNYPGYMKFSTGGVYITNIPSLLFNFSGSSNLDNNLLISTGTYYIVNKNINFPYAIDGDININQVEGNDILRALTNNSVATLTGVDITSIINGTMKIDSVFSTETLNQFGYDIGVVSKIIGTINPN